MTRRVDLAPKEASQPVSLSFPCSRCPAGECGPQREEKRTYLCQGCEAELSRLYDVPWENASAASIAEQALDFYTHKGPPGFASIGDVFRIRILLHCVGVQVRNMTPQELSWVEPLKKEFRKHWSGIIAVKSADTLQRQTFSAGKFQAAGKDQF